MTNNIVKKRLQFYSVDSIFNIANYFFMILIIIACVYPFYYCTILAFNDGLAAKKEMIYLYPKQFTLDNFKLVLSDPTILKAFLVTVMRTIIGPAFSVTFNAMIGYSLSRSELKYRKIYISIGLVTLFFSGGIIPTYMVIRGLGLYDNFFVYIFPLLSYFYNVLIFITFFQEIPGSLIESARLDGAHEFYLFIRIVLPVSKPVFATIALFAGVYHWNSWMETYLYTASSNLRTVASVLMEMINQGLANEVMKSSIGVASSTGYTENSIRLAAMVISTVPIICVYPYLQRFFIKGIMLGAVKG